MFFFDNSCQSQRSAGSSGRQWREDKKDQRQRPAPVVSAEEEKQKLGRKITEAVPKGTCQTMCPVQELQDRVAQNRLHHFEMVPGTEKDRRPKGDPLRAVKEYARPAAGKDATNPTDLRPPAVLLKTVHYLINEIAATPSRHPWTEVSRNVPIICGGEMSTVFNSFRSHRCFRYSGSGF